jgi:hypothetical protein
LGTKAKDGSSAVKTACLGMALLFAICPAVLSACGGGEADVTDHDISDEELALMVLPQEEFGGEYAGLELDEAASGFLSNEEAIETNSDGEDEQRDIERFGRVNGYTEVYSSPLAVEDDPSAASEMGLMLGTGVELLRDSEGASGRLEDEIADYEREFREEAGAEEAQGADLQFFSIDDVGDEATGLQMEFPVSVDAGLSLLYNATHVSFRRGRLVGAIVIGEFVAADRRDEVVALARKLDERIQAVLRGDITPSPATTP